MVCSDVQKRNKKRMQRMLARIVHTRTLSNICGVSVAKLFLKSFILVNLISRVILGDWLKIALVSLSLPHPPLSSSLPLILSELVGATALVCEFRPSRETTFNSK